MRRRRVFFGSDSYLFDELLVHRDISIGTVECLLQESKEYRDNDNSLQGLSKDDEEDWNGENVDSHYGVRVARPVLSGDFRPRRRQANDSAEIFGNWMATTHLGLLKL